MGRYRTAGGVVVEMSDTAAQALGFEPAAEKDSKDEVPKKATTPRRSRKTEQ